MKQQLKGFPPVAALRKLRRAWRQIVPFLGLSRLRVIVLGVSAAGAGATEAGLLALIASIAAALSAGDDAVDLDLGPMHIEGGLPVLFGIGFGLAVLRAALHVVAAYLPSAMSANAMANLRRELFDAFCDTSWSVQAAERDGHFQALMSHVGSVARSVTELGQALSAFFMFSTMVVSAIVLSLPTALALIVLSTILFMAMRPLSRRVRATSAQLSEEATEYSKGTEEVVRLAEETQVFGASRTLRGNFHDLVEQVRTPMLRTRFLARLTPVAFQSLALIILLAGLLLVAQLDTTALASLGAVVLILIRSLSYGQQLQSSTTAMYELAPFLERVSGGIDYYRAHPRQSGDRHLGTIERIGMRDVHFSYVPGDEALGGVSFEVHAGESIGIVGPSGAGKSTIVQLLLRLREPNEGVLHVNDIDAREFRRDDWQERVSYVPQSPQLLWGSVTENIRYFRDQLGPDDIERAARLAHIHDEVMTWPDGYDTIIGERAAAVSGGQRQRICFARALAARPDVLILDEPTSALDVKSEKAIQESLHSIKGETILFMVAHRMSTLSVCDRVMVIVDGKLQAIDTPQALQRSNAFYMEALEITRQQSEV